MTAQTPHAEAVKAAVRSWFNMPPGADVGKIRDGLVADAEQMIRAYLAAMAAKGWKMVGPEATLEQGVAMWLAQGNPKDGVLFGMDRAYRAMLSAAPPPEGG